MENSEVIRPGRKKKKVVINLALSWHRRNGKGI